MMSIKLSSGIGKATYKLFILWQIFSTVSSNFLSHGLCFLFMVMLGWITIDKGHPMNILFNTFTYKSALVIIVMKSDRGIWKIVSQRWEFS